MYDAAPVLGFQDDLPGVETSVYEGVKLLAY